MAMTQVNGNALTFDPSLFLIFDVLIV